MIMNNSQRDPSIINLTIDQSRSSSTTQEQDSGLKAVRSSSTQCPHNSRRPSSHQLPPPYYTRGGMEFNEPSVDAMEHNQFPQHESDISDVRHDMLPEVGVFRTIENASYQLKLQDTNRSLKGCKRLSNLLAATKDAARPKNYQDSSDALREPLCIEEQETSSNTTSCAGCSAPLVTATASSGEEVCTSSSSRLSTHSMNSLNHTRMYSRRPYIKRPLQASIQPSLITCDINGFQVPAKNNMERPSGSLDNGSSEVDTTLVREIGDSIDINLLSRLTGGSIATTGSSQIQPLSSNHKSINVNLEYSGEQITSHRQELKTISHISKKQRLCISDASISSKTSSDSGTEGGYAGEQESSPSRSSGEDQQRTSSKRSKGVRFAKKRKTKRLDCALSSSSYSADFKMYESDHGYSSGSIREAAQKMNMGSMDPTELARITLRGWLALKPRRHRSRKHPIEVKVKMDDKMTAATQRTVQALNYSSLQDNFELAMQKNHDEDMSKKPATRQGSENSLAGVESRSGLIRGKAPIFNLSSDLMAHCMAYLEPPVVHTLLTMPLSKDWYQNFTKPQDLWRVLCLTPPFNARFDADEDSSSDEYLASYPTHPDIDVKHLLGRYRILYTSFVRCMKYLSRIKDDAVNGRPPSVIDYGSADLNALPLPASESLKRFLARARGVVVKNKHKRKKSGTADDPIGINDDGSSVESGMTEKSRSKVPVEKVKYGQSQLSARLLGPSKSGKAGNVNLPWSCAIYSIVNWMVAFADVEGIQTLCLSVLPCLLEDDCQRTNAPLAGLTDIVLRGMVLFPDSVSLNTAAFHTIVLLARPLGGKEGMLFHSSMVNSSGIFNKGSKTSKNGIAVMLDSMRRFESEEVLQAMSCWSLVNIALAPSQKAVLVKLGGLEVVANAMIQHPYNVEVQFRALFALINLVIPSVNLPDDVNLALQEQLGEVNNPTEKEVLDENVDQIANLVVLAMKNFCSSEAILNRACLVLHNLSLTEDFHRTLLWTPNCYQMLEWCLANYRTDRVLQQSAGGTLHRLQTTLSNDEDLRLRFTASLQLQDQFNLENAHLEALRLHERQELLESEPNEDAV